MSSVWLKQTRRNMMVDGYGYLSPSLAYLSALEKKIQREMCDWLFITASYHGTVSCHPSYISSKTIRQILVLPRSNVQGAIRQRPNW